ncbi:MAG: hypothetical protein IJ605_06870 [Prevotella sp.]|nr:hypothetical protein [Prevotella sp.]
MKKMLLLMVAAFTATTTFAQFGDFGTEEPTWTKTISAVEKASDAYVEAPVVITSQGDVIKTGVFSQEFTFAGETLEPIAKSAYIVKYDKEGNEVWANALRGAATITAMTLDEEGNIYVAGRFADKVIVTSTDDNSVEIEGMEDQTDQVSGFILAYDAAGKLLSQKTVVPSYDFELFMTALENEGFYLAESKFVVNKIVVANGKVYVSANYMGNNTLDDVVLEGKIFDMFAMKSFCFDLNNFAVIQLDKDLTNAKLLANVNTSDDALYGELQMEPQALKFALDGEDVYVAWTGWGDVTMATEKGTQNFSFSYAEGEEGGREHGFVVANVTTGAAQEFRAPLEKSEAGFFTIANMEVAEGKLYIGGTYIGALAFDNQLTSTGACDAFMAALNTTDLTVEWAKTSGIDEGEANKFNEAALSYVEVEDGAVGMVVNAIDMSTKEISQSIAFLYIPDYDYFATMEMPFKITSGSASVAGAVVNSNVGTESTLIYFADEEFTQGIETIDNGQSTIGNSAIFNLQGQRVNKAQKGVFIQKGQKFVVK